MDVSGNVIKYLLVGITIVSLVTGVDIILGGAVAVPEAEGGVSSSIDSELRFFSAFWVAYGVLCFWVSRDLLQRLSYVPAIAGVMFLGGVARCVSWITVGTPATILVGATILELVLPPLMILCYRKLSANQDNGVTIPVG